MPMHNALHFSDSKLSLNINIRVIDNASEDPVKTFTKKRVVGLHYEATTIVLYNSLTGGNRSFNDNVNVFLEGVRWYEAGKKKKHKSVNIENSIPKYNNRALSKKNSLYLG